MKLPLVPIDKANHFIWGCIIFVCLGLILPQIWAFIITGIIAGAKEIVWDLWLKRGTPDVLDFFWTMLGTIPPIIFHWTNSI